MYLSFQKPFFWGSSYRTLLFSSPIPSSPFPSPRDSLSVLLSFSPTPCCLNTLSLTLVLRVDSGISETIVIAIQGQLTLLLKPGSCLLTLLLHMPPFFNPNSKRHGHLLPFSISSSSSCRDLNLASVLFFSQNEIKWSSSSLEIILNLFTKLYFLCVCCYVWMSVYHTCAI